MNAPNPPHCTLNWCFDVFCTIWVHPEPFGCLQTPCKTGRTSAKVRATKSSRNFSQRTHPIHPLDPKLMFWCVLYYLGAFRTVWLLTKLGGKRAELVQKFVPRSRVGIFLNERTRSTPLDPKLIFWCVLYYLGASGTVWLLTNSV